MIISKEKQSPSKQKQFTLHLSTLNWAKIFLKAPHKNASVYGHKNPSNTQTLNVAYISKPYSNRDWMWRKTKKNSRNRAPGGIIYPFFILMFLEWPADGDDVFEADSFLFHEMLAAPEKQEKMYKTKKNNVIFGSCWCTVNERQNFITVVII